MSRAPLAEISANRVRHGELSPYVRGAIQYAAECGDSMRKTANALNLDHSTIRYTLDKNSHRIDGETLPRTGRPRKYSHTDSRNIVRFVPINPKSTYEDIHRNLHIYLSHDTFSRILDSAGIKNWRAKQRPTLRPEHVQTRYAWAKVHSNWKTEWELIIFSDECSVERRKGKQRKWVFHTFTQKWNKEIIEIYNVKKDICIMI